MAGAGRGAAGRGLANLCGLQAVQLLLQSLTAGRPQKWGLKIQCKCVQLRVAVLPCAWVTQSQAECRVTQSQAVHPLHREQVPQKEEGKQSP